VSTTLTPTLKFQITGARAKTDDKESAAVALSETIQYALTNGTGDDQVDLLFSDTRTVTTGADDDLDLAGVLTDVFGAVLTFAKVKAIVIYSKLAANKVLSVGGDGSNGFTTWLGDASDKVKINGGGLLALIAPDTGFVVTGGTGDILRVTNASGGSSTYDIWIFGTSA
jgi:hypothetical protein